VGVEDPSGVRVGDPPSQQPHEAGQHDDVDTRLPERLEQRVLRGGEPFRVSGTEIRQDERGDLVVFAARGLDRRARPVGEHEMDVAAQAAPCLATKKREEVRALAGDADGDPTVGHATSR
jgi:hypothetical protein